MSILSLIHILAELLKKNSKPELAKEVEDLIKQYAATPHRLNGVLKSKPFYKEFAATYLPKLRKVQYTYGCLLYTSHVRPATQWHAALCLR